MDIRLVSDLHLDFDIGQFKRPIPGGPQEAMDMVWLPSYLPTNQDTTLVIAGDIWTERRFATRRWTNGDTWIDRVSKMFKHVVLVLGNHDYWGTNLLDEADKTKQLFVDRGLTNVHLLERDVVVLDEVKFVGATLWTDFNKQNPLAMFVAKNYMNDYRYTRFGPSYHKITAYNIYEEFRKSKDFIFKNVGRDHPDQKVVVVTHMAPSFESVNEKFRSEPYSNFFYASSLENEILDAGSIDYWFHGHMHDPVSYEIGDCKVRSNPRGYGYEPDVFDPDLTLEV